jgi:hypothetical protein
VTGAAVIDGQDEDEWLTPYHERRATVDEDGHYSFAVAPCVVRRLTAGIAQAEYFDTGNDLWGLCTDNVSGHNYLCIGMSTAYFDMMLATGYRCAAPAVDREKVRDVVLKYLTDNPDKRGQPASELAIASLKTAFQCVEPAPPQAARPASSAPKAGKPKGPVMLVPNH